MSISLESIHFFEMLNRKAEDLNISDRELHQLVQLNLGNLQRFNVCRYETLDCPELQQFKCRRIHNVLNSRVLRIFRRLVSETPRQSPSPTHPFFLKPLKIIPDTPKRSPFDPKPLLIIEDHPGMPKPILPLQPVRLLDYPAFQS